jgi:[ribosomal protein S5]-alanine N-acetyltransferase
MPCEITAPETIKAERLTLRRYEESDAAAILKLVMENQTRLMRDFGEIANGVSGLGQADTFIKDKASQWKARTAFCYGIFLRSPQVLIGQLQVKNITWNIPAAEMSYFIAESVQRRGYASEAVRGTLRMAFEELGFKRIFVRIIPSNSESILLARKLGFREEGLHRNAFRCGFGELHDVFYFSMTGDEHRRG